MTLRTVPMISQAIRPILEVVESESIRVDRKAGVIHDVRILGPSSANRRRYLPEAISAARNLYEGKPVNYDHPRRDGAGAERSIDDRAGWLLNVQVSKGGLSGDFHYLKSDPRAAKIVEAAERNPNLFGLSHNAEGRTRRDGEITIVEEITKVRSVDLVSDPATTRSLFESMEQEHMTTIKEIIRRAGPNRRGVKTLLEFVSDGILPEETPVDVAPQADTDQQIEVALNTAAKAAIDDPNLDAMATTEKVGEIMAAKEDLIGGQAADDGSSASLKSSSGLRAAVRE